MRPVAGKVAPGRPQDDRKAWLVGPGGPRGGLACAISKKKKKQRAGGGGSDTPWAVGPANSYVVVRLVSW